MAKLTLEEFDKRVKAALEAPLPTAPTRPPADLNALLKRVKERGDTKDGTVGQKLPSV